MVPSTIMSSGIDNSFDGWPSVIGHPRGSHGSRREQNLSFMICLTWRGCLGAGFFFFFFF